MSIDLKPHSLECGRSFTVLNLGSSKKQGALQIAPFKMRCPLVFLIVKGAYFLLLSAPSLFWK